MMATTPDEQFWSKHARSTLGPLLSLAGSYTASDQASHLRFFDEHVASCLGSQYVEPNVDYWTSPNLSGTRFEISHNLTTRGKAKVRFGFDLLRDETGPDPFGENNAREMLHRLCSAVGGDPMLMNHLMETFFLSPSETEALRDKFRPRMHIPPACVAFDLEGHRQILKAYFPVLKKATLGKSPMDTTLNALRDLEPLGYDISHNLDLIEEYLASCQVKVKPVMIGIDCLDPKTNQDSRLKIYAKFEACTFAVARDVITLGGRLSGEPTLKKVNLLRSIWHLLLNEPDGISDDKIDTLSKQDRSPGTSFSGLLFSIDLVPGMKMPDVKVYVPVFQYAERTDTTFLNTNAALKAVGHEWGQTGRFNEAATAVL
ncbi:7-dimethylallyltryptophan synthase [Daldinia childiae]|uniref:7-dimethylallyltryptophan synthase n=1 Tax=Daldinia childiae TaxID=326645 RepID=UPI0014469BF2|nr:7-dimethylallyltryptophan synthase [Daldinia childiae]KAF3068359.1 7-dimethylallyltryptophan synthase [Daldinia childiae]